MKTNVSISVEISVIKKCKEYNLCISRECEKALREVIINYKVPAVRKEKEGMIWSPKRMMYVPIPN